MAPSCKSIICYCTGKVGRLHAKFFVSLFSLQCYRNRSKGVTETDLSLREKLTKLEKEMLENQELVEIRGKVSNLETIYLIFVKIQVHVSI